MGLAAGDFAFRGGDLKKKLEKKIWIWGNKKKTPFKVRNPVEKHKKPRNGETKICQICRWSAFIFLNILHDRKCRNSGLASRFGTVWKSGNSRILKEGGEVVIPLFPKVPPIFAGEILKVRTLQFSFFSPVRSNSPLVFFAAFLP